MTDQYIVKVHSGGMRGTSPEQLEQELNQIASTENLELISVTIPYGQSALSIWKKKS